MKGQANKHSLVWGGLMVLFGGVGLIATLIDISAWGWVAILVVAGLGGFAVYSSDRSRRELLIPPYVMWAIAGLVALIELNILKDDWIAAYALATVALPFLATYLRDRTRWWALIPAYVLLVVGLMVVLLEGVLSDSLIPAYVMFAIALPFFVVYFQDRRKWWALIPGGILATVGSAFLIAEAAVEYVVPAIFILVGAWILVRQLRGQEPAELAIGTDKLPTE